ncbi:MAG: hypothetical protein ABFS22_09885 [Pseudomonadota bacterium]
MKKSYLMSAVCACAFSFSASLSQAAEDAWTDFNKVTTFKVSDHLNETVRIIFVDQTNPAACPNIEFFYIDIELGKRDRTRSEFDQMMNTIYLAIATDRDVRFLIDGKRCTSDGTSLALGIEIDNN